MTGDDAARAAKAQRRARRIAWAVRAGGVMLRLLARTWRVREVRRAPYDPMRQTARPMVVCAWHGELLCHLWAFRGLGIVVLISEHADGEILARVAESLGYGTVRGSSRRGAARALLGLIHEVEAGRHIALTPDGPLGPPERFAPGALVVAQRTGAPIVALRATASRAWRLRSWDRLMIPKPFARVTIYVGDPVTVDAPSAREAADRVERFEALMRDTMSTAHA